MLTVINKFENEIQFLLKIEFEAEKPDDDEKLRDEDICANLLNIISLDMKALSNLFSLSSSLVEK